MAANVSIIPVGLVGTEDVMPKEAKMPRLLGRIEVRVKFGKPISMARFEGRDRDRFVLRSITDELMYEIMQLSGQEYLDEYASRTPSEPLPESARPIDDITIDLSEEILAG
jgi:1-acyl-sn-glycerol-3-phosphate acyltransferase